MSFNDDQIDYMRSLGRMAPEEKCWCAWFKIGECPHCPPGKTLADRLKVQCPDPRCGNYPEPTDPDGEITHNIKCGTRHNALTEG